MNPLEFEAVRLPIELLVAIAIGVALGGTIAAIIIWSMS